MHQEHNNKCMMAWRCNSQQAAFTTLLVPKDRIIIETLILLTTPTAALNSWDFVLGMYFTSATRLVTDYSVTKHTDLQQACKVQDANAWKRVTS